VSRIVFDPGVYEDDLGIEPACEQPPWTAPANGATAQKNWRRHFVEWTRERLFDRIAQEYAARKPDPDPPDELAELWALAGLEKWPKHLAIKRARRGDIDPLREYVRGIDPDLVQYINLPERKRGERYYPESGTLMDGKLIRACDIVHMIRDIWVMHYGKKNRGKDKQPTAEEIAARFVTEFGGGKAVTEDDVFGALKKTTRRR
jgi:hypothetical protein